jgi:hypothetical protein
VVYDDVTQSWQVAEAQKKIIMCKMLTGNEFKPVTKILKFLVVTALVMAGIIWWLTIN